MKNILFVLTATFLLASCATSYHPKSFTGGYSEIQMDKNIFRVSFRGNGKTTMERAVDFALLRSSELTLRSGYKYFTITKGSHYVKEHFHIYADPFELSSHIVQKPRVAFDIHCYHEKPEKHSYNAFYLVKSIKEKYRIKK